jgi:hypothetical protein
MTPHHLTLQKNSSGCLAVLLWPFMAFGTLSVAIIKAIGRIVALILGFVLMIVGALLCLTIIGAIIGVPLILVGLALVVRSLF